MRRVVVAICAVACAPDPEGIRTDAVSREPTWCQVQAVLEAKCQRCHADPPKNGAPFPLVAFEDTQVLDRAQNPRYQRMHDAVESEFMPATWMKLEPPVEPLTDNERAVILEWAASGGEPTGGLDCR
jgi:uncharacterized membrane protein